MTSRRDALAWLSAAALLPAAGCSRSPARPEPAAIALPHDPDCVFCRIAAGQLPAATVYEDEDCLAFATKAPRAPGHTLLVPRRHVRDLYALPDELAGRMYRVAPRLARAIKQVFRADGVTCRQNNEAASDQTVFHYHMHFIPRFTDDGLWLDADGVKEMPLGERERVYAPLRVALSGRT